MSPEGTSTIHVGAGEIMLPNHSPIVVAEQFGTLESLYPGRIDLGLGRAPGTDQRTLRALRRDSTSADNFPQDVRELHASCAFAKIRGCFFLIICGNLRRRLVWLIAICSSSALLQLDQHQPRYFF
jgi:alkanesulfonate monooxygenase SsuD/methylene tetrahydromethanopterin reductase-like flavin-dependent oxidoreductase (luciferase family)